LPNLQLGKYGREGQVWTAGIALRPKATFVTRPVKATIGFNIGAALDLLSFPDPVGETLVHLGGSFPVGEISIYTNTFALGGFNSHDYGFII
jgi:hypothetical protein